MPLYWKATGRFPALEVLAHRLFWSFAIVALVLAAGRKLPSWSRLRSGKGALTMTAAKAWLIAGNWLLYIWGVNNGYVVEASLGYFTTPLVAVFLGAVILGERLSAWQWAATGSAGLGILIRAGSLTHFPWVAVALALSFALYGLLRKLHAHPPLESLFWEGLLMQPIVLAIGLPLVASSQVATFSADAIGWVLLAGTGVVTFLPFWFYARAMEQVSLSTMGLMQYLAPTMQLMLGVTFFRETVRPIEWVSFSLVWAGLLILTIGGVLGKKSAPGVRRSAPSEGRT